MRQIFIRYDSFFSEAQSRQVEDTAAAEVVEEEERRVFTSRPVVVAAVEEAEAEDTSKYSKIRRMSALCIVQC